MILIAFSGFGAACLGGISWHLAYRELLSYLRAHHATTWKNLNEPKYAIFPIFGRTDSGEIITFLARREYLSLKDDQLSALCRWAMISLSVAISGAMVFAICGSMFMH